MAQVKLNLQPPPNVDFVSGALFVRNGSESPGPENLRRPHTFLGYPGIPPGPNRPQASVRGAIEVRVPPAGVKAKFVRIELRKVETLPGGGAAYNDPVGPSPVNLWSTADEYGHLRSQDFPFSIRIPESIPPTIALDNRAGIGYELVATVCTKGKRGFLRKAKSITVPMTAPVIIDKHELHSTWPVYCQPEQRQISQDDINLIVERNRTCFGPGDRISVIATVKSDSLHTVILRGFQILLKEATVFRPSMVPGRRAAPLANQIAISETKVDVNATLYGGTSHNSELACMVPANHTTPTLTSARHIDVTYTLSVKALLGTGTHLAMELPIIMSNWQREVSFEAINRIGPTPGLSLLPQNSSGNRADPIRGRPADVVAATLPINRGQPESGYSSPQIPPTAFNSAPQPTTKLAADELGIVQRTASQASGNTSQNNTAVPTPATLPTSSTRRTTSSGGTTPFKVANPPEPSNDIKRNPSTNASASTNSTTSPSWLRSEEEKVQLYEKARARAERIQGVIVSNPTAVSVTSTAPTTSTTPPATKPPASQQNPQWLTAEEEKLRLFEKAQEAAARTHATASPPVNREPTPKIPDVQPITHKPSAAAALYAEAMGSRSTSSSQVGGSSTTPPVKAAPVPYMTAAQEKAALRRYEEAKRAVDRTQNTYPGPIAYESLFPADSSSQQSPPPPAEEGPPSFDNATAGPSNIIAQLSEKERLRKEYDSRDAVALGVKNKPPAAYSTTPPPAAFPGPSTPAQYANALEEKEVMRRKLEARDAQLAARPNNNSPPQPPPRSNGIREGEGKLSPSRSVVSTNAGSRPAPVPPATASGTTRVLSAAEEKALLRSKYDTYDSSRKTTPQPPSNASPPLASASTPPPLMPRPPAEYIKETQEEDARLSRLNGVLDVVTPGIKLNGSSSSSPRNGYGPLA